MKDYHTIGDGKTRMPTAEGGFRSATGSIVLTHRWYLHDAAFTVCLEDDIDWAEQVKALDQPTWQPYLGRRSCVPVGPLVVGTTTASAADVLSRLPLLRHEPGRGTETVRVELADSDTSAELIPDHPAGARRFLRRPERVNRVSMPAELCAGKGPDAWARRRDSVEGAGD